MDKSLPFQISRIDGIEVEQFGESVLIIENESELDKKVGKKESSKKSKNISSGFSKLAPNKSFRKQKAKLISENFNEKGI